MAQQRLEEIIKTRQEKVNKLRELGIEPYPTKVDGTPRQIVLALVAMGKTVEVAGRLMSFRGHGNVVFADLKDETGQIQLWFQKNNLGDKMKLLKYFDIGDFVYAQGKVVKTAAGEISVDVEKYQMLAKSIRPLPSAWHGLKDIEERYRKRYLDLVLNNDVRDIFIKRSKIITLLRSYLNDKGFLEVKTPVLQPIYGGATAKPFITHHNTLNSDLYLRIADELYLKRLITGGFHKVYEIGTDFRNEGIDRWHNPEFQMLEFYWAFANYEDLMLLSEEMLSWVVKEVTGDYKVKHDDKTINFKTPWRRLAYKEAFKEYANLDIDKIKTKDKVQELDSIYKEKIRPKLIDPVFLIDHPFEMRPLAKRSMENKDVAETIQLVAAGAELFNAYTELNDPQDQRKRWEEDMAKGKRGAVEFQVIDEDYIMALEYGMPPTAGWGMGIDRFTAVLTNQHALKDVILFPTLKPEGGDNNGSKKNR